jgi:N-acetylglucosamine-6-phosphate deacetylase
MERLFVRSSEIYAERGVVDGSVVVTDGRIEEICPGEPERGSEVLDVRPHWVFPGLLDMHIHGAGGWNVEGGDPEGLRNLARYLASMGVTGFQPTLAASPPDATAGVAKAVGDAIADPPADGARILGLHMEGPYLSPKRPGAMDPTYLRDPSRQEIEDLDAVAPGVLRHLTLAPERAGALELIEWLVRRGVVVSGGHTDATYDEARAGVEAGIRLANHTFNAMRGLHQREPGALAAFVLDERVACELIADGRHVHPAAIDLLLRLAGPERVCLVSDAVFPAGLRPGVYELSGRRARVTEDGSCLLPDGRLAGSAHLVLHGIRTLVEQVGTPITDAVRMASAVPARVLGLDGKKGALAPERDADLIAVSTDWEVIWTLVEGRVAHAPGRAEDRTNPAYGGSGAI